MGNLVYAGKELGRDGEPSKHKKTWLATSLHGFTIAATWERYYPGPMHADFGIGSVEFKCYEVRSTDHCQPGGGLDPDSKVWYERSDKAPPLPGSGDRDDTMDLEFAKPTLEGWVKWDGCCNIDLYPESDGYFHECSREGAMAIGPLIGRLYDIAKEIIPNFDQ